MAPGFGLRFGAQLYCCTSPRASFKVLRMTDHAQLHHSRVFALPAPASRQSIGRGSFGRLFALRIAARDDRASYICSTRQSSLSLIKSPFTSSLQASSSQLSTFPHSALTPHLLLELQLAPRSSTTTRTSIAMTVFANHVAENVFGTLGESIAVHLHASRADSPSPNRCRLLVGPTPSSSREYPPWDLLVYYVTLADSAIPHAVEKLAPKGHRRTFLGDVGHLGARRHLAGRILCA